MRVIDAAGVAALGPAAAVDAIVAALQGGLDPAAGPPRCAVGVDSGQLLLMPAQTATAVGVKVVSVAPGNAGRRLPRIQGAYLLFDHDTLAVRAILDGTALTTLRTPAVSVAAALRRLPDRPLAVVVIGGGPQAFGHLATLAAVRPIHRTTMLVRAGSWWLLPARRAEPTTIPGPTPVRLGTAKADGALRAADVVVCATSAREPLFRSELIRDDAVVIAVGSHEPDARELDAALLGRAMVVVEDVATALREAGDVVLAVAEGTLDPAELIAMQDVVTGAVDPPADRPLVIKTVGMAWQDLVVAEAVLAVP